LNNFRFFLVPVYIE